MASAECGERWMQRAERSEIRDVAVDHFVCRLSFARLYWDFRSISDSVVTVCRFDPFTFLIRILR